MILLAAEGLELLGICFRARRIGNGQNGDGRRGVRGSDALLTEAKADNPKVRLVLCEPFTLPVGKRKENYETWRAGVQARQDAVARLAAKHGAALVRFQQVFDAACKIAPAEHWIWDGVHPTYSGHQLMADEWERTVREKWPSP